MTQFKAIGRRALVLAGLFVIPTSSALAQFEYGSVNGVVLDSITRKPVGGMSVAMPTTARNGRGNNVLRDGHFDFDAVPVGDSMPLTMYCALGEPMQNRIIARGRVPIRSRQATKVEVLVDYSACFAPIAKTQRIHATGVFFASGGFLDSTFTPCAYEPLATALSVWNYGAQMRFARHLYRGPEAPDLSVGVYPRMYRGFVTIAGTLRGPGVYANELGKHAPYEIVVDSMFEEDSSHARHCEKREAAPRLEPGTVTAVDFARWRAPDAPPPAWTAAPRDSSKDVPPSKLANHGNVEAYLIDRTGHPVAGARMSLDPVGPTTVTDSTGHYLLRDVPFGDYALHFRRFGYRPDFTRFTLSRNEKPLMPFLTPERVFADPAAETDSARRTNTPGANARARRHIGITMLGEELRARPDSARRPAFDPLDPKLLKLLANTKRCGSPAYFVDGFLTMPAHLVATGVVRLGDFASSADVDMVQVVASKSSLNARARDDAAVLSALPSTSCRPLVLIWTRYVKIVD